MDNRATRRQNTFQGRESKGLKPQREIHNHVRICTQCGLSDLKCDWTTVGDGECNKLEKS